MLDGDRERHLGAERRAVLAVGAGDLEHEELRLRAPAAGRICRDRRDGDAAAEPGPRHVEDPVPGQQGRADPGVLGADEFDAGTAGPVGRRPADNGQSLPVRRPRPAGDGPGGTVQLAAGVLGDPEVAPPLEREVVAVGREGDTTGVGDAGHGYGRASNAVEDEDPALRHVGERWLIAVHLGSRRRTGPGGGGLGGSEHHHQGQTDTTE